MLIGSTNLVRNSSFDINLAVILVQYSINMASLYTLMPIDPAKLEIRLVEILPCNGDAGSTAPIPQGLKPPDEPLRPRVRCRMKRMLR
jgi:hypothetical protein